MKDQNQPKSKLRKIIGILFSLLIFVFIAVLIWFNNPSDPGPLAELALNSDSIVRVDKDYGLLFQPKRKVAKTAFVLYPGARIKPESYADTAHEIASQGYLVIVPKMLSNFALFSVKAGVKYKDQFPQVENWVIGGHSVGGTAAAQCTYDYPDIIKGLILWASYPDPKYSLKEYKGEVVSIWADHDGLIDAEKIEESKSYLPDDTQFVCIKGGNHQQFADYSSQLGDHEATISIEQQHQELVQATLNALKQVASTP